MATEKAAAQKDQLVGAYLAESSTPTFARLDGDQDEERAIKGGERAPKAKLEAKLPMGCCDDVYSTMLRLLPACCEGYVRGCAQR